MGYTCHHLQPYGTFHAGPDSVLATDDWPAGGANLSASPGVEWSILPCERGLCGTQAVCGNSDGDSAVHSHGVGRDVCAVGNAPGGCTDGVELSLWVGTDGE